MMGKMTVSTALVIRVSVLLLALVTSSKNVAGRDPGPRIGDTAPAFVAIDEQGRLWKSSQRVGKRYLVIYFYQGDFKFCAVRQAQKYRDRMAQLAARNVEVVGISGDTVETHRLFKQVHGLNFTLLADERGTIAKLFGVPLRAGSSRPIHDADGNAIGVARRGVTAACHTFIIGRNGIILNRNSRVSPLTDSQDVMKFIDGGDGWVYSFDPQGDGQGGAKLLWKFDGNPKTSKWILGGRGSRNNIIAFPAIYDGLVYVVMGQDPEHGEGSGHLWCIDPKKGRGGSDISAELAVDLNGNVIPHRRLQAVDVSKAQRAVPNPNSAVVWHYSYQDQNNDGEIVFEEEFHRSLSIPVIKDDILYISDFSGLFHCLHAKTGRVYWTYDQLAACWGSAVLVDGKVYICDEDGDVTIFRHSADPGTYMKPVQAKDGRVEFVPSDSRWQGEIIGEINMRNSIYMTPIVANNTLYIANKSQLFAIEKVPTTPPGKPIGSPHD